MLFPLPELGYLVGQGHVGNVRRRLAGRRQGISGRLGQRDLLELLFL